MSTYVVRTGLIVLLLAASGVAEAQWDRFREAGIPRTPDGEANLNAPPPRDSEGHVNLSGIWLITYPPDVEQRLEAEGIGPNLRYLMPAGTKIPFRPPAEALYRQRGETFSADRPSGRCLPHGIPDAMLVTYFKWVQTPGLSIVLFEEFTNYRQIFTDGRPFPDDPNPQWFGYSKGEWDGDTFMVRTRGFNDRSWLDDYGLPHTEQLVTTERFERPDLGHMDLAVTIDDRGAYTAPWSFDLHFALQPDTELIEDICENERDFRRINSQ